MTTTATDAMRALIERLKGASDDSLLSRPYAQRLLKEAAAALSLPQQSGEFVMVPRDATPEMRAVGSEIIYGRKTDAPHSRADRAWKAMLSAAPTAPAAGCDQFGGAGLRAPSPEGDAQLNSGMTGTTNPSDDELCEVLAEEYLKARYYNLSETVRGERPEYEIGLPAILSAMRRVSTRPAQTVTETRLVDLLHRARYWFEQFNHDDIECRFLNSAEINQQAFALEDDLAVALTGLGALP